MELAYFNLPATNALLRLRRERKINWRAFGLGMVIASFTGKGTGEAWPSRRTLAEISGIESRDVPRVTAELRDAGFLAIEERKGRSNLYRLTYGEIAAVGKQPPTCGDVAAKPMGKQPPITIKEQERNKGTASSFSQHSKKGDGSIAYLADKVKRVEAEHGEDVARRYDAKAREHNSTIQADAWLEREIG